MCKIQDFGQFPLIDGGSCCMGAGMFGGDHCSCWQPVFDEEQVEPDVVTAGLLRAGVQPTVRPGGMCPDCAYRPDSPERRGDPRYKSSSGELDEFASESRFWCHEGLIRPVAWVHGPSGTQIAAHPAQYRPPQIDGVPYRVTGQPGYLCAGWAARRRALVARQLAAPDPAV